MSTLHSTLNRIAPKLFLLAAILVLLVTTTQRAPAQTLTTLYSFAGPPNDGVQPMASPIVDSQGNVYGTTYFGGDSSSCGSAGCGTVFKVSATGSETVLHSFNFADGANPEGALIMDMQGNVYGTTSQGGRFGRTCDTDNPCGTVFEITPSGTETTLHNFRGPLITAPAPVHDGYYPWAGLIMDTQGNLYGTTYTGGPDNLGTVFELTAPGSGGATWNESILHSFDFTQGWNPTCSLVMDAHGNLYGTTSQGGEANWGTVFKLAPNGTATELYAFTGGEDGGGPYAGLIMDAQGNLYGTGIDVVFELTPDGTETVLHTFGQSGDGYEARAGLVMDSEGNLYGTTVYGGGPDNLGTVYKVTPSGTETVLHAFSGPDGGYPWGGLAFDVQGNLYGTTSVGGANGQGTVFKLTP
jgi:uncharacterized repeat protein (TIGR03803 family)